MFKKIAITTAGIVLAATMSFAESHVGPYDGAIKARKAHMTLYGHNIGTLASMAQGKSDYDAETAAAAAANLLALATMSQQGYWPPGSDTTSGAQTRALPALWENFPDVSAKSAAFVEAVTALNSSAGDGLDALRTAIGPVGAACGACHKAYRAPE